ncbi:hypothetical protein BDR07DRAFT_1430827 [Suillus spraguei]|nr:hypothetical protein BDR07DRAFT_1430827 [Suillus spraguei]
MLRTLVYGKPINACVCLLSFILSVQTTSLILSRLLLHFPVILPRSFDHPCSTCHSVYQFSPQIYSLIFQHINTLLNNLSR